jgi:hypothetical protein
MSIVNEVACRVGAHVQVARVEQPQLDLDDQPRASDDGATAGVNTDNGESVAQASTATDTGDIEAGSAEAHVTLLSSESVRVRPDLLRGSNGSDLFLPAKMSAIPWNVLERLYRAFWIVLAAALGVSRESIKFASGERIVGMHLHSAASYLLSSVDALRLAEPAVRARLEVAIALMAEQKLWVSVDLQSLYPSLPWQDMVEAVRQARDEVKAKRLPCQVAGDIKGVGLTFVLGPDLAPQRPAKVSKRDCTEVGHCNGFRHRYDQKLYFAKNDGNPPVDITFDEERFLDKVMRVARRDPPWIEVKYEEVRHDDVVVSRVLLSLEVTQPSLQYSEKND